MAYWRSTKYEPSKFLVTGTELATALVPGTLSRYQLCEVRCYDALGHPDRRIAVRDAATISDDDVARGKRPAIVGWFDTEGEAIEAVMCAMQLQWFLSN